MYSTTHEAEDTAARYRTADFASIVFLVHCDATCVRTCSQFYSQKKWIAAHLCSPPDPTIAGQVCKACAQGFGLGPIFKQTNITRRKATQMASSPEGSGGLGAVCQVRGSVSSGRSCAELERRICSAGERRTSSGAVARAATPPLERCRACCFRPADAQVVLGAGFLESFLSVRQFEFELERAFFLLGEFPPPFFSKSFGDSGFRHGNLGSLGSATALPDDRLPIRQSKVGHRILTYLVLRLRME